MEKKFLNVDEAAAILCTTKPYLYKLIHERKIGAYKPFGGRLLFDADEIEQLIRRGRVQTMEELEQQAIDVLNCRGR
jgi:excisionase family DNA binding protein